MSAISGSIGAASAKSAGDAQAEASRYAADLQYKYGMQSLSMYKQIYEQGRRDYMPWLNKGKAGLDKYWGLLENPQSVKDTPGYGFRMNEGISALDRSAAARGRVMSGSHEKDLVKFGQDYATNEYDTALSRYSALAGLGFNAIQGASALGSQYSGRAGETLQNLGNALGQQALNRGSAYANSQIGMANAFQNASSNAIQGAGAVASLMKEMA